MAVVQDYISGNILTLIKKGFRLMRLFQLPVIGPIVKKNTANELKRYDPHKVTAESAAELIRESDKCAAGQRICNALNRGADFGESIFLDELAEGLVQCGKAKYVDKRAAIRTITKNQRGPIMVTRVSGKQLEICRAIAKNCIYWNLEKHGLRCVQRC